MNELLSRLLLILLREFALFVTHGRIISVAVLGTSDEFEQGTRKVGIFTVSLSVLYQEIPKL